jgi:hypothetical protein
MVGFATVALFAAEGKMSLELSSSKETKWLWRAVLVRPG